MFYVASLEEPLLGKDAYAHVRAVGRPAQCHGGRSRVRFQGAGQPHHSPGVAVPPRPAPTDPLTLEVLLATLTELVDHVVGVDPDRDSITIAVGDAHATAVLAHERFAADAAGYQGAISLADQHSTEVSRCWAVEGTSSYGRGLLGELERAGEMVVEFDQPRHKSSKSGAKSDALDAIRAAREALGRDRLSVPTAGPSARSKRHVKRSVTAARPLDNRGGSAGVDEVAVSLLSSLGRRAE